MEMRGRRVAGNLISDYRGSLEVGVSEGNWGRDYLCPTFLKYHTSFCNGDLASECLFKTSSEQNIDRACKSSSLTSSCHFKIMLFWSSSKKFRTFES